ncbi:MAG: hypothetical protein A2991_04270 [Candidatus Terrybacteria bacterium RIFCSPLOWO2_01_FULL_58_14]|uniref:AMP-dependent synthetase/ligase domain-containing protein n=1 Tax=Candidatus Terrybacteria bacterium RIFCSPLOWO2_01_FULL_58_14 TaxID=1802369 RepID=A0A1G2PW08_9BACT|nr:MAG: hypothetical protein A2991_04270 [Candidatus Terrybacteria bacterium RIFCSPLOWO2_01_FULL_58_14]
MPLTKHYHPAPWRCRQDRRLRRYLQREIVPHHPYYRERFRELGITPARIHSVADLQRIPGLITQKRDIVGRDRDFVLQPELGSLLRADPAHLLAAAVRARGRSAALREFLEREYRPVVYTLTTGRSSARTAFVFTRFDLDGFVAKAARGIFSMLEIPRDSIGVSVFPVALHLAHVFSVEGARAVPSAVLPLLGLTTEQRIAAIETLKPFVLFGVTSYVERLVALAAAEGKDFSSISRVVVGGEGMTEAQRQRIVAALCAAGAKDPVVVGSYGFTEARLAMLECLEGAREGTPVGYHCDPDLAIIETVRIKENTDGAVMEAVPCVPGEEGEVLFTPLSGHGTVVLRWRTRDVAILTDEPCPACGSGAPRILPPIRRRSSDMLKNVRGTLVDFDDVARLFANEPAVRAWQITIGNDGSRDTLVAALALDDGADVAETLRGLQRAFKMCTEVTLDEILVEPYEALILELGTDAELKERRIVDER